MLKIQKKLIKKPLSRRDFLSQTTAIGGLTMLAISTGPVQAVQVIRGSKGSTTRYKRIHAGNATAADFSGLVGKRFRLQTEDGEMVRAQLIEVSSPQERRAPRFRREHFSIVFDVPASLDLVQGHYRVSHPLIGSIDLFMVPVDLPAVHNRLEGIFT